MKKILKYNGLEYPKISHADREKKNLNFKVINIKDEKYIEIDGNESDIADYLIRNPNISLSSINDIINKVQFEPKDIICNCCSGTGKIPNPLYKINEKLLVV